ncbi:hypothetical protein JK636_18790 [Clostridium sp. YIM B02515]|uniref:Uncharacterized protein n=1 Tax=Clostridium rhizosphaerae TaxID=2803861 RepID=A0ABS1TEE7_9CLOT|nr:hypothetical protein [Clostridium rhizosphaerae]MBL4937756.1 hypothetical protein [Clostridium rhizosphaerae]
MAMIKLIEIVSKKYGVNIIYLSIVEDDSMKKIIVLTLSLVCIVSMLIGCSKHETIAVGGAKKIVSVIPIEANRIKVVHEAEKDKVDFEVTITDETEIKNILGIYNSMKVRQMSKPLNEVRFIITFYHDEKEIAVWWVDRELTTACSNFEGGNHVIENKDFNYGYFEKLLKK